MEGFTWERIKVGTTAQDGKLTQPLFNYSNVAVKSYIYA